MPMYQEAEPIYREGIPVYRAHETWRGAYLLCMKLASSVLHALSQRLLHNLLTVYRYIGDCMSF